MSIDANVPADSDLLSTHAAYIREVRARINVVEDNETDDLLPGLTTCANADTSPSVDGALALVTANAGATTVTFFDGGYEGQFIVLIAGDANTTIQHDAGLIQLSGKVSARLIAGEAIGLVLQNSIWHEVGGYRRISFTDVTTPTYAVLTADAALRCNAGATAITCTLPLAVAVGAGQTIRVKKTDSTGNDITIVRNTSDTINAGVASIVLTLQNESVTFVSDGVSDWTTFN